MKTILFLLVLVAVAGCKEPSQTEARVETRQWTAPAQGAVEVYVNQFTLSPTQGSILRTSFTSPTNTFASTSTNQEGKPAYSATISYVETDGRADHYSLVISYPVGEEMRSEKKEIYYSGSEIEIFRDSEYRIGIRPSTEKQ